MRINTANKIVTHFFVLILFTIGGCYTVLMDPSRMTSMSDESSAPTSSQDDYTSDISYNQNCLSCHSQAELDNSYYGSQNGRLIAAHGMSIDPYGWRAPSTSLPWWSGAIAPVPPTAMSSSSSPASESGPRQRTTGSTRGGDQSRPDIHASTSAPTITTTTTTAPPPPTADAATSNGTTTDRSRTTSNNSVPPASTTRKTGSNRGGDKD